jgi:hypothetical protein
MKISDEQSIEKVGIVGLHVAYTIGGEHPAQVLHAVFWLLDTLN